MSYYHAAPVNFAGVSQVTASLGDNDPELGYVFRKGDEEYVFVYNAGGEQINPGEGCILSAVSGYSVTVSSVTAVGWAFGVVKHATLTTDTYGWVMRKGFCPVEMSANNSAAAGDLLVLGTDGLWANKSVSTGHIAPAAGKAMEAIASGASGQAYISIY